MKINPANDTELLIKIKHSQRCIDLVKIYLFHFL
jgi:hypothetical protein